MKASICLLLAVAMFSTLFLESSTASTGDGLLGGIVGGVLEAVKNLLAQLVDTVTPIIDKITGLATGLLNESGTLVQNTSGATKDIATIVQTLTVNLIDTIAKIIPAIETGTTESLNAATDFAGTGKEIIKQLTNVLAANSVVAGSFKTVDAVLENVPELIESLIKSIDQVKVQVSV